MKINLSRANKKILIFILAIPFLVLPFGLAWGANPGDVVINEVFYDPIGTDTGLEWIELYNPQPDPIDLNGYDLGASSKYFTFPSFVLASKSYVIIHWNATGENTSTELYTGINNNNMGNSSGWVALFKNTTHSKDTIVDYIEYGVAGQSWESAAIGAGIWQEGQFVSGIKKEGESIGLKIDGEDNNSPQDWQIFTSPTPGKSNLESISIHSQPLSANAGDNDIISTTGTEITFDASASTGDIQSYSWNFGDGQTATGKIVTHKYQYPGVYYVSLIVSDGSKNESSSPKKVTIFSSQIFISEFLPDPKGSDSGKEWIEIVNESSDVQNISGWGIGNNIEKPKFIFPDGSYLAPKGLVLLSSTLTKISLSNESGSLFLFYPSKNISQEVKYENLGEDVSIARKNGEYFYTKNPTPGMENIISLFSKQVQSNDSSYSQGSTSSSGQEQTQSSVQSQSVTPTQESQESTSSVSETNKVNEVALTEKEVANLTSALPKDILNKDLLAEAKANQTKLILSIVGVILCSGFFGTILVILRRKLKNKNIGDKNIETIEVKITD